MRSGKERRTTAVFWGVPVNELALFAGAEIRTHWKSSEYSREKAKAWRLANPERVKAHRAENRGKNYRQEVVRKYGVHYEWFDTQYEKQQGRCAICHLEFKWSSKQDTPHVDHCHESMAVRGILCNRCNTVLGLCRDNQGLLEEMARYINCHG